jgi:radical SAM superfamily enzyme with C-terminal helix-hairpin-helix motif
MLKVTILDGYVDEPTCLGVPPYISPYPRYISGAILDHNNNTNLKYYTIDQLRNNKSIVELLNKSDILILIAGMTVPGRYLSGYPISPNEIINIFKNIKTPKKILCGPAAKYGFGISGGKKPLDKFFLHDIFDLIITGDAEIVISELLKNNLSIEKTDHGLCRTNPAEIKNFSIIGGEIVKQHPFFPDYTITEIETYRGCSRSTIGGCSFCTEALGGLPIFREINDILLEIKSLYVNGIRHFRLGNQPCIFSYMAKDIGKIEFPKPNPTAIEALFNGIRKVAPNLKTLHIDNVNPGVITNYPNECKKICKIIIKNHTSGDVAALGIESADPVVIKQNNLKISSNEGLLAIKLLNEMGSKVGSNGLPELLPGLNFVFGLKGETKNTFKSNYEFLMEIMNQNLLVRRVNIRQVIPIPGTKMFEFGNKNIVKNKKEFQKFKRKFKTNFEQQMLKKIIPTFTVIKDVYTEIYKGKTTFGRQLGSYPILVGIPGKHPLKNFFNIKVVDHGYRSITGLPYPININSTTIDVLSSIPGIGRKRAIRLIRNRPFRNKEEIMKSLDDKKISENLFNYIMIN